MNCPDCGAPMRLDADKDYFACDYCGNIHAPQTNEDGVRVLGEAASEECPICAAAMVHASVDGQRMLYCQHCHGMLIGMDIFGSVVGDLRSRRDTSAELIHPLDTTQLDRHILCPQCRETMDTHVYGGGGNVVISDCERCETIWLDHGQLDRIVRAPDPQFSHSW